VPEAPVEPAKTDKAESKPEAEEKKPQEKKEAAAPA
jgi:hypothetical protein